jgi:hypothetical protein
LRELQRAREEDHHSEQQAFDCFSHSRLQNQHSSPAANNSAVLHVRHHKSGVTDSGQQDNAADAGPAESKNSKSRSGPRKTLDG